MELIFEYGPVAVFPRYTLYPATDVDVLPFQDKSTACWMVTPEPLAVSKTDVEVLVKKEMFAETEPATVGVKVALKGRLWPAARVIGKASPPRLKAELVELAEDRVTLPPLAVTLPLWV